MANKVIGINDVSGAVSLQGGGVGQNILIVAKSTTTAAKETILTVGSTLDAETYYGENSPLVEAVRGMIIARTSAIKTIIVADATADPPAYPSDADAYAAALELTAASDDIGFIVLDTTDSAVMLRVKEHLNLMELNNIYRYAVTTPPATAVTEDDIISAAEAINSSRIFMVTPNLVSATNTPLEPVVIASAVAAQLSIEVARDPSRPFDHVVLTGYTGLTKLYSIESRDKLTAGGVTPIYRETDGSINIWRLVTTNTENPIWHEGTTIFVADNVLISVITRLKANYKRTKNIARVLDSIRTDVIGILDDKLGMEIIESYDPTLVSVIKDPADMYGAIVDYSFKIITPLYTITVRQHISI